MKKLFAFIFLLLFLKFIAQDYSKQDINISKFKWNFHQFSVSDSLEGFDEASARQGALQNGCFGKEFHVYMERAKRNYIKRKYNLKDHEHKHEVPVYNYGNYSEKFSGNANVMALPCVNEDFEQSPAGAISTPNGVAGWILNNGSNTNNSCTQSGCCTGAAPIAQIIQTPFIDPKIGNGYPLVSQFGNNGPVPSGNKILRINDDTRGAKAQRLQQTFPVTPNNAVFRVAFVSVIEDGSHACCDQPGLTIMIYNLGTNSLNPTPTLMPCPQVSVATPGPACNYTVPGVNYQTTPNDPWWNYNPWNHYMLDLTSLIGNFIRIEVTVVDCIYYGHGAYAYVDFECTSMAVTVNGQQFPLGINAGTAVACGASNATVSAPPGFGPYVWNGPPGSGISNYTNQTFTTIVPGVYTITMNPPNSCGPITKSVTINFGTSPTASFSTVSNCNTFTFTNLGSAPPAIQTWSFTGTNPPASFTTTASNTVITFTNTGTYTVSQIMTDVNGCMNTYTQLLNVYPPPVFNPSNNSPLCSGLNLQLSVNTSPNFTSYAWSGPNGFSSNQPNPTINNINVNHSGNYSLTIYDNNGCFATYTTNVIVHPLPIPTAGGASLCTGQNAQLTSSGGTSYQWSGPNGFSSNQQNPTINNVTQADNGVYTVTVTSANNCTASATANMVVYPLPSPTLSSNSPICQNQNLQLSVAGGVSYQWAGPNGYSSTSSGPVIFNAQPNASGTYSVLVTSIHSCTNTATIDVTVNPLPNITAANSGSVCEYAPLNLFANGGVTYTWSGPANFSSNLQNPSISQALVTESGIYQVVGTDANGCVNSATTLVDIQPNPVLIVSGATVCSGSSASLTANTNGISYQWFGPGGYSSNAQNAYIPVAGPLNEGTYSVVVTGVNSCTSASQAYLSLYPDPTVAAVFSSPTVCLGGTVQAIGQGGYAYSWLGPNNLVVSNDPVFTFTVTSLDFTGNYTLGIIGEPYGCKNQTVIPLTVLDLPKAKIVSNDKKCIPFCASISAFEQPGSAPIQSYYWNISGVGHTGTTITHCINSAGNIPLNLVIYDINGCRNIINHTLTGYPIPVADFYYDPLYPVEIVDNIYVKDASYGENLTSWNWYVQGENNLVQNFTGNSFMVNFENAGTYMVALVVENGWGCKDTAIKPLSVLPGVIYYIPNAFTPNGDGLNDNFGPKGYGPFHFELDIFDRWGEKIFTSRTLDDPWDGTYNGEECKPDVYVWKIKVYLPNGKTETKTGHVTLVK
jgi:gliding motility-associated-like protein